VEPSSSLRGITTRAPEPLDRACCNRVSESLSSCSERFNELHKGMQAHACAPYAYGYNISNETERYPKESRLIL